MKRKKLLAALLAMAMLLPSLAGCAANPDEVLGMVGETPIYRWFYQSNFVKQLELYTQYSGTDLTKPENKTQLEEYKKMRLNDLVGVTALKEEARVRGLNELTAEEEATIDQQYIDFYNQSIAAYQEQFGTDDAGLKKAEKAYEEFMAKSSLTPDRIRVMLRDQFVINKLVAIVVGETEITEEILKEAYESDVKAAQDGCELDKSWFGMNVVSPIVYAPEGYRETARIFLKFTAKQELNLATAANAAEKANQEYESAVMQYGSESAEATRMQPALDMARENFTKVLDNCYAELTKSMEVIRDEVAAGADFLKTMEEKSDDAHLMAYFVCEGYSDENMEPAYLQAALALQNVGDISEVIQMETGVCIIRLMSFVEPGVRPYEEVKDALRDKLINVIALNQRISLEDEFATDAFDKGIVTLYEDKLK